MNLHCFPCVIHWLVFACSLPTHIELSFRCFVVKTFIFKCKSEFRYRTGIKLPPIYFVFRIYVRIFGTVHTFSYGNHNYGKNQTLLKDLTIIPYIFLQLCYAHYEINDTYTQKYSQKSQKITKNHRNLHSVHMHSVHKQHVLAPRMRAQQHIQPCVGILKSKYSCKIVVFFRCSKALMLLSICKSSFKTLIITFAY